MQQLYSLYIHWPFCSSKCYYCDFVAFAQHDQFQDVYHQMLLKEIEHFIKYDQLYNPNISTIFLGGGTPSLYPLPLLEELFELLKKHFNMKNIVECTLEANPADIDEERLDAWMELGINRLSVGVQVLDDDVLMKLNRRQRTRDVLRAFQLIPKYIKNWSSDLILGLPGVYAERWEETLKQVVAAQGTHVSIYFLTVHEKTPLYFKVNQGQFQLHDDDLLIDQHERAVTFLAQHGFEQYEISNFARPGFQSLHNKAYWDLKPYKGFGVGSSSYDGNNRFTNQKNLSRYLQVVRDETFDTLSEWENLSDEQKILEALMLGLRQTAGMDLQHVIYLFPEHQRGVFTAKLAALQDAGFIGEREGKVMLTHKGMILENEVILKLV